MEELSYADLQLKKCIKLYFLTRIARKLYVIENSSSRMQDSYKADFQIQFCNNDFNSNTRIPRDFYNHMTILQGFNLNTIHLRGFWANHEDIVRLALTSTYIGSE